MKSKKLLITTLVALAVPFGTLSGGFVKAEGIPQPATPSTVTPKDHPTDTPTTKESNDAENKYLDAAEAEYKKLNTKYETGEALVNSKPEYKLPAATQTPKKQVNPMNKNVKKALPKTSAVK
ncbi:hypothetical protein [Gemella sp.]